MIKYKGQFDRYDFNTSLNKIRLKNVTDENKNEVKHVYIEAKDGLHLIGNIAPDDWIEFECRKIEHERALFPTEIRKG